jgi:hypothetical protein
MKAAVTHSKQRVLDLPDGDLGTNREFQILLGDSCPSAQQISLGGLYSQSQYL